MLPRVYIETTIPSYLTARPNRDLVRTANQQLTREWWERRRADFEVVVSELVLRECAAGDPGAAAARLTFLAGMPILTDVEEVALLAQALLDDVPLPQRASADAYHVATAAVHGVEYLLTWNCAHLANAVLRRKVELVCSGRGYRSPVICTPQELLGEQVNAEG